MMESKDLLTVSNIKYLLTIKQLAEQKGRIKSTDIAKILGVSRPSVHRMMDFFKNRDIIIKDYYTSIALTEKGLKLAEIYDACYDIICRSISKTLPFDIDVSNGVYAILAESTSEQLEEIYQSGIGGIKNVS